jgi:hypothetical protein
MPTSRWRQDTRTRFIYSLFLITVHSAPAIAEVPEPVAALAPSQQFSPAILQARFAKLQQIARPNDIAFELRLVDEAQALRAQQGDGIVRLPQDWAVAAPDGETLDFLMLLGLADAIARKPIRKGPSTATKIITGTLGFIGANIADNRGRTALPFPHFDSNAPSGEPSPALRGPLAAKRGSFLKPLGRWRGPRTIAVARPQVDASQICLVERQLCQFEL